VLALTGKRGYYAKKEKYYELCAIETAQRLASAPGGLAVNVDGGYGATGEGNAV
jgi:hypothetical protein